MESIVNVDWWVRTLTDICPSISVDSWVRIRTDICRCDMLGVDWWVRIRTDVCPPRVVDWWVQEYSVDSRVREMDTWLREA